jgi:hypothetical protein
MHAFAVPPPHCPRCPAPRRRNTQGLVEGPCLCAHPRHACRTSVMDRWLGDVVQWGGQQPCLQGSPLRLRVYVKRQKLAGQGQGVAP